MYGNTNGMSEESPLPRLLEGWLDGNLPEAEALALLRLLDTDPELRRAFAREVAFLGKLRAASDAEPRWLALFDEFAESADPTGFEAETMSRIEEKTGRYRFGAPAGWIALAAAVVTLGFLFPTFLPKPAPPTLNATAEQAEPIAIVTGVRDNGTGGGLAAARFLPPGEIRQTEGWLGIQTMTGVSITLTAPFRATLVSPDRVIVSEGQARVRVPEGAEGFVLESPDFEILDLGTEFAARVNPDGTGTFRVFEGEADVSFLDSFGKTSDTRRVNAGEGLRIYPERRSMKPADDTEEAYAEMEIPAHPSLAVADSYPAEVLLLKPAGYWRFDAADAGRVANEVPGGADIISHGGATLQEEAHGNRSARFPYEGNDSVFVIEDFPRDALSGDFSLSFYVQFDWIQNYTLFACSRWNERVQGEQFLFKAFAAYRRSGINGTGIYAQFREKPAYSGGAEIFGNRILRPKFWHHVALTRAGGEVRLHLDGEAVARESIPASPIDFDTLFIGRSNRPSSEIHFRERGLVGNIDELAVFGRALSDSEIRVLAAGKREP
jgi:hypothetical protein